MRTYYFVTFLFLATVSNLLAQQNETKLSSSSIEFSVSNFGINTVHGSFDEFSGKVVIDTKELEKAYIEVCINAKSIDTGNKKRDKHLRSDDFLSVMKYPEICFKSEKITQNNEEWTAYGILSLHGNDKEVKIPLSLNEDKKTVSAIFEINRRDYEVGPSSGFMVGKEITIKVNYVINQ